MKYTKPFPQNIYGDDNYFRHVHHVIEKYRQIDFDIFLHPDFLYIAIHKPYILEALESWSSSFEEDEDEDDENLGEFIRRLAYRLRKDICTPYDFECIQHQMYSMSTIHEGVSRGW